nr:hypothetical protein [Tanacetum cinerariifolium]
FPTASRKFTTGSIKKNHIADMGWKGKAKDLSWTGLPELVDNNVIDYSRPSPTVLSTSAEGQIKDSSTSKDVASPNPSKPFVKRRIQRERTRSQKYAYESPSHKSVGHISHRPSMRPFYRPAGHIPHGPTMNPRRPTMNGARPDKSFFNQAPSYETRPFLKSSADSGCSRHMTGNISYLSDFEPFDGGYVSFGQGGCKITGKETIKTECIVLGRNFKLLDDANILLKTPRQHNMYSIDLNNIVPHKNLTCLVAKASADECTLWHRRLGHLNVKTMNTSVRHNLVRGLPTKSFNNDHTCTACLKGKQHKASCKSKLVNSMTEPLHTLHMDLFGPTSVSSISHKWYCLVVTDDFSRYKRCSKSRSKERCIFSKYIVLPNWAHDDLLKSSLSKPHVESSTQVPEGSGNLNPTASSSNPLTDQMETLTVESLIPTGSDPLGQNGFSRIRRRRGIVVRNKARLVAQGHTQEEGIDYDEVFARVARIEAIRLFLACASFMGFTVYQMDV